MIPFWAVPRHWGLKGIELEKARINHEYDGEARERKLIDLEYDSEKKALDHLRLDLKYNRLTQYEFELKENEIKNKSSEFLHLNHLKIKLNYNKITEYDYDVGVAKLNHEEEHLKLALLKIDLKYNKISQYEYDIEEAKLAFSYDDTKLKLIILEIDLKYEKIDKNKFDKETSTLKNEPWVGVKETSYDKEEGPSGFYFDLDCNDAFIKMLTANEYRGKSQEEILQNWFNDLCKTVAIEGGFINPEEYQIDSIDLTRTTKKPGKK